MTRSDAVRAMLPASGNSFVQAKKFVDALVVLGLLQVEMDPKAPEQEAEDWLLDHGWTNAILNDIRRGGFKIVRADLVTAGKETET